MNKLKYLGIALATLFVACDDDDYTDWAEPQSYAQQETITLPGYTAESAGSIDLAEIEDGEDVIAFTLSSVNLPDGAVVGNTRMEVTYVDDAGNVTTMELETDNGSISKEDLQAAVESICNSKAPEAREFTVQVYSNIIIDGQSFLVDAGTITLTVTPYAPKIEAKYYFASGITTWGDGITEFQFSHSDEEDLYVDPVFTYIFTIPDTETDIWWQVIGEDGVDDSGAIIWSDNSVYSPDDKTALSGSLHEANDGGGQIVGPGMYKITINMLDYSYKITTMAAEYYMTGSPNGWVSDFSSLFYPVEDKIFDLTTYYSAAWDVKVWSVDDVGDWDNIYGCPASDDNVGNQTGTIVYSDGDQDNIGCITSPTAGYYTLTIDMAAMTYTWTEIETPTIEFDYVAITGDFNGWAIDGSDDTDMTQVAPHNWYIEKEITSDGGFKFCADHDSNWTYNWGLDLDITETNYGVGTNGGPNITVPAGTYRIYLNDITGQFAFIAE